MAEATSYRDWLKNDFTELIAATNLPELQQRFLRSRWLGQVLWMEGKAEHARNRYYVLRLTAIIGGLLVPSLVSTSCDVTSLRWLASGLGLLIAMSAALEEFFHYGERWRHYRRTVETLKTEGWHLFQLSGPFDQYKSYAEAYPVFAARIEEILQQDVGTFVSKIGQEKDKESQNPALS